MAWRLVEGEEATAFARTLDLDDPDEVTAVQVGGRCGWVYWRGGRMECRICGDCDWDSDGNAVDRDRPAP